MKYYLAYGSNLNKEQMANRCPGAEPIGAALIHDYELVFRRGFLTIEPHDGAAVPVGIWRISDENEKALDRYEGYPKFYRKEYFNIPFWMPNDDGANEHCLAYVMNEGFLPEEPSYHYLETVYKGYNDFCLDCAPLDDAVDRVRKETFHL